MANRELLRWVSDQLHPILGYSVKSLSEYILTIAGKAQSLPELLESLGAQGVPINDASTAFARQLFKKAPRVLSELSKKKK